MKILLVNNYFRTHGGEAAVIENERANLESHGEEVELFSVTNDWSGGPVSKLSAALSAAYSRKWRRRLAERLRQQRPDVMHVHNFFPLLTPSVYDAGIDEGVPVVHTLHNYRLICAASLMWRQGRVCERCLHGTPYLAPFLRCYRNSFFRTLAAARMVATFHRRRYYRKPAQYIVLTEFARQKFIQAGFPPASLTVKPNFVFADPGPSAERGRYALFVGRLDGGKGIETMLEAWRILGERIPLRIVGEGLLQGMVEERGRALEGVEYLGYRDNAEVMRLMKGALVLVFPSETFEGFPMTIAEAFAASLPVVASRLGAMSVIVRPGETGEFFEPGSAAGLVAAMESILEDEAGTSALSRGARREYEARFNAAENYRQLMAVYRRAVTGGP